jgi:hypothetical protein
MASSCISRSQKASSVFRARNSAERATLGDYFLVDAHKRHIIVRDHVYLDRLAAEMGALQTEENLGATP